MNDQWEDFDVKVNTGEKPHYLDKIVQGILLEGIINKDWLKVDCCNAYFESRENDKATP